MRSPFRGYVKVCNKSDATLTRQQSLSERSTCGDNPGNGFLCSIYSPRPVSNTLSYAFAVTTNRTNCCKCFQLHWTDGPATGKSAIVQAINIDDDVPTIYPGQQFGILTAGGGGYNHPEGCLAQYNAIWGRAMGGIYGPKDCEKLPSALQGSCYWRWNWVGGDMIGWPVAFDQVECPSELTSVSGCSNF